MLKLIILLAGALKLGKAGGTVLTMLISLAVYASLYGWRYAAGFIFLLYVHEMGHYLAARERGLNAGAPSFIPFVGAWIALKESPRDAETEAYVASAGPLFGTVGAIIVYLWARQVQSDLLLAIAYSGFFLNFFNLIPLSPLDGGRITGILSPRIWLIGAPLMLVLMLYRPSALLVLIIIMSIPYLIKAWHYNPQAPENRIYYATSAAQKWQYGLFYLGLAAFLAVMTDAVHAQLTGAGGF